MTFPKQIQNLIEAFERLPGIGPKTAERLTFYLLHVPDPEIKKLADSVQGLKQGIVLCSICKNISSKEICDICSDSKRDHSTIAVVENALDVFSLERTGKYSGVYHVLHGVIDPMNNIGPEELYIKDLLERIKTDGDKIKEVILALNPTMEGEATAMYLTKQFQILVTNAGEGSNFKFQISRLGIGIPIGGDLQYADETTLTRALEGRSDYK